MAEETKRLALEAICTDLRRGNPRWSDKRIRTEAKVIYKRRNNGHA